MCLAVPGKVIEISGDDPLLRAARVSFSGVVKSISLACTPEAKVGDYVLVHVGIAISVVDPQEAAETFRYLKEMGELEGLDAAIEETDTPRPVGHPSPEGTLTNEDPLSRGVAQSAGVCLPANQRTIAPPP